MAALKPFLLACHFVITIRVVFIVFIIAILARSTALVTKIVDLSVRIVFKVERLIIIITIGVITSSLLPLMTLEIIKIVNKARRYQFVFRASLQV